MEQVAKDGKLRKINFYNLDVIISVGYRVNSKKATKFRKWATTILKDYINDGYVINHHRITEQRLLLLENDVNVIKSKIKENKLETNQGIFYDGQIYDSYSFINDLLKIANNEVILIDNYVDDTVLTLFSKYQNINFITQLSHIVNHKFLYKKVSLNPINRHFLI
ncbi:virulence RhuM family protein [Aliarcobacter butzleri]|uniref:virulence RhuM family protein n=1 Tax=Aliarcobacter butzleri TaxID=28197 RepID=UPI0021B1BE92|nr:virulence RhuM family protein [Aliarcobacter butzleri]MCT7573701.1 virulence RhuM family protein [Aliarcobacter butzleri]